MALRNIQRGFSSWTKKSFTPLIDWRMKECVIPVKDQGTKGVCYAVAIADAAETAHAIATDELVVLSAQELIDNVGSSDGSDIPRNLAYAMKHGISLEEDYPFIGEKSTAPKVLVPGKQKVFIDYHPLPPCFPTVMMDSLKKGPLLTTLNVGNVGDFDGNRVLYGDDEDPDSVEGHASMIVAAGHLKDVPVWVLKGTYSPEWGHEGYYYVHRSVGRDRGAYGINSCTYLISS